MAKQNQKQNDNNKNGNNSKIAGFIIIILLLLIIVSTGLLFVFDVAGIKNAAMGFLHLPQKNEGAQSEEVFKLQQELKFIENEKTRLKNYEQQLNNLKSQLEAKHQELEQWDLELQKKEKDVEDLQQKLSVQFQDIKDIAKMYENMEGEQAASILSEISDTQLVIQILKNMPRRKSAEVLGLMDAQKAAALTKEMAGQ